MNANHSVFHCYQRTIWRAVIFYSDIDHLMYFTVYCTKAVRYNIKVFKLVQMPDHLHHSLMEMEKNGISRFLQDVISTFTREYNKAYKRSGRLFDADVLL